MKKLLPLVFIFLFLTSGIIVFAEEISLSMQTCIYYGGNTRIQVYPVSSANTKARVFVSSGSDLQNSDVFLKAGSAGGTVSLRICSAETPLPAFNRPTSPKYIDWQTTSLSTSTYTLDSNESVNVTLPEFDPDLYYAFFTEKLVATMYRVPRAVSTPTPTPVPDPTPTPGGLDPTPGVSPVPSPTPSGNLDDYTFWSFCYDQTIKNGSTSSRTATHRFVPSSMADFSGEAKYNYVYTYPVRIPFRVEASKFNGVGFFDANFKFDFDYEIFGQDSSPYPNYLVDYSSPWIESTDPLSFNATLGNKYGNGFDVINVPLHNGTSSEFYFCFDMYVSISSNSQLSGFGDYVDVNLDNIAFKVISSTKVSDSPSEDILGQIRDEQKNQNEIDNEHYQEEQDKIAEAEGAITDGAGQLTDLLSGWEIFTMPFQLVKDFMGAISSDGDSGLTFPSFTLMGQQLWPSYTFDLKTVAEKFPVLYNALHVMTGIMVVRWFIFYCWRKWRLFTGDDMPDGG